MTDTQTRLNVGRRYLAALEHPVADAHHPEPSILAALRDIAPDLATLAIGFAYGDLYARPGLDLRHRQLATVAALAALGNAEPQLRFHLAGALNVGCKPVEIIELMIHLVVYAGFPAALNGISAARAVFADKGVVPGATPAQPERQGHARREDGLARLREIDGAAGEHVIASLADIAPDLGCFVIEFAFGDIYTRPGLGLIERELITVAALAAMGSAAPQLRVHMHGFLNVGGTRAQLVEVVTHLSAYAGFPRAINAAMTAGQVMTERDAHA